MLHSPLTKGKTQRVLSLTTSDIITGYKKEFGIEVDKFFSGLNNIELYRCIDSGYEFYYPANISGDNFFYKKLAKFDWYYNPWKWEHERSLPYLKETLSILEVGCGSGSFLRTIKEKFPHIDVTGLEISVNESSEKFILNQTIEDHLINTFKTYELVCFYQVLEHIYNVNSFLAAAVNLLKKGGHLIISVPNNSSVFFNKKNTNYLNMPPHHMGLWSKSSLNYLTKIFPLQVVKKYYEPIQEYHFEWFKEIIKEKTKHAKLPLLNHLLRNQKILSVLCNFLRKFYRGHSIMFVYKKI